jgi:hypothetical protein
MTVDFDPTKRTPPTSPWIAITSAAVVALAAIFALLSIQHVAALALHRKDWATDLLGWWISNDFAFGARSPVAADTPLFERSWMSMGAHMVLGSIALLLGALQFWPALRHLRPAWHRAGGLVVWLATFVSMAASIVFLAQVPVVNANGAAFRLDLWGLAGDTLFLLSQAILAALSRDFRGHMVWMALCFAALLVAPGLRLDWMIFGKFYEQAGLVNLNLAAIGVVFDQTLPLMALWLLLIGDRDLSALRPARWMWPAWLSWLVAGLAIATVVDDGLLVPLGWLDPFATVRAAPPSAAAIVSAWWAVASVMALGAGLREWRALLRGKAPSAVLLALAALVGLAAAQCGYRQHGNDMVALTLRFFWVGYACVLELAVLGATRRTRLSSGRNPWALVMLCLLGMPALLDPLTLLGLATGAGLIQSRLFALVIGTTVMIELGLAASMGVALRLWVSRQR